MQTWEANVRRVVPYTPGEQPDHQDMIKLNTNENPYPPAPGVYKALSGIEPESLRLYPDPAADDLVKAIAEACGVKKQQVFVGVGSDDVLAMSFLTFFNGKSRFCFRILHILFMMSGRSFFGFLMNVRFWMSISISKRRLFQRKRRNNFSQSQCSYRGSPVSCGCGRDCGA